MACDCKCKFKCQCECKKYRTSIKDYGWNPSACICGSSRYLKSSIVVDSVVVCDKIISVTDRVSTNVININVSVNSEDEKVRYEMGCYILHTFY